MATSRAIISVMGTSFAAMAKVSIVSVVGYCCAIFPEVDPLLPVSALRYISRLSNIIFLPSLIVVSLGSSLNIGLLARIGVLMPYCILINTISYLVAHTIGRLLHEENSEDGIDRLFIASTVAIGSPNAISLPIMVMQTLCEDNRVNAEFAHNSSECFEEVSSMLFVYSIAWFLMFWSYGFPLLKSLSNEHTANKETVVDVVPTQSVPTIIRNRWDTSVTDFAHRIGRNISLDWMKNVFLSPSMVAIFIGLLIGLVPALQQGLFNPHGGGDPFDGTFRPLGSAIVTLGEPLICVNCLVMAASLAQTDLGITSGIRYAQSMIDSFLFKDVETSQQNQWAKLIRIEKQLPAKDGLPCLVIQQQSQDDDDAPIAMKSDEGNKPKSAVPKLRTIATHLLCRLILSPLIMLPIIVLSVRIGVLSADDRMMQLMLLIESATPSAQVLIVCVNQLGTPDLAANLAYIFVYEYFFSILTITFWTTIAISTFYGN
eukprot:gene21916-28375_t